jgi:autotransporter adhesin
MMKSLLGRASLALLLAGALCAQAAATPGNNGGGNGGCGVGQQTNGCGGTETPPPVLIPGPMGPQGPQGIPGESIKGDPGAPGKDGIGRDGIDGKDGVSIAGADGKDGKNGESIKGDPGTNAPDAVTTSQMDGAIGTAQAASGAQINSLREQINNVSKAAYAGTAAALALQMPALNPHKPEALTMRVGVGSYKGQSAVGISFRRGNKTGDWSVSGGVSGTSQGTGVALGVEHSF